jgi:fibronectin type 3 domain-containing protein
LKKRIFSLLLSAVIALSLFSVSYAAETLNEPASFSVSTEKKNPVLKWSKVQGATGYVVYRLNSDTGKYDEIGKTAKLSYTDKKVKSSSACQYYVRAVDEKSKLGAKSDIKNTIAKTSNIEKSDITSTSVKLSWYASKNAKKYIIEKRTENGEYEAVKTTSKTTFTVKQLKAGTSYKFRIRPKSNIGKKTVYGERSAAVSVKTLEIEKTQSSAVYITENGTKYHLSGCRYLSKSAFSISLTEARRKYSPCSVCKPPN